MMQLGMQVLPRSIPASGTFIPEDLVMKIFLRPFFRLFKKSSCQLMVKECTLSTVKLPLGGLPGNSVVTTWPQLFSGDIKQKIKTNKQKHINCPCLGSQMAIFLIKNYI